MKEYANRPNDGSGQRSLFRRLNDHQIEFKGEVFPSINKRGSMRSADSSGHKGRLDLLRKRLQLLELEA